METVYNAPNTFNKLTDYLYNLLIKCVSLRNLLGFIGFILTIVLGFTIVTPISFITLIGIIHPIDYVLTKLQNTIEYLLNSNNGIYNFLANTLIMTLGIPMIIFYIPAIIHDSINKKTERVEPVVEETIRVESQRIRDMRRRVDELNRILQCLPIKDFKPIHNIKRHRFISPDINTDLTSFIPLGNHNIAIGGRALTTAGTNNFNRFMSSAQANTNMAVTMGNYIPGNYIAGIDTALITNPNTLIY
jgi:hypothetical protein